MIDEKSVIDRKKQIRKCLRNIKRFGEQKKKDHGG